MSYFAKFILLARIAFRWHYRVGIIWTVRSFFLTGVKRDSSPSAQ